MVNGQCLTTMVTTSRRSSGQDMRFGGLGMANSKSGSMVWCVCVFMLVSDFHNECFPMSVGDFNNHFSNPWISTLNLVE